jgi:D-3-phosphoglycerate dehydrogenase
VGELQILVSAPYLLPELQRFEAVFEQAGVDVLRAVMTERLSEAELLGYAGEVDGVLCGDDQFTAQVLERFAPRLKAISKWGTGVDSIDLRAAEALGIKVFNTPDAFTDAVADSVMGYVLCFARDLPWLDAAMKRGDWEKRKGYSLAERTLGVIGVGSIGRAVLTRARAFGMRLLGNDIVEVDPKFVSSIRLDMGSLGELLEESDYVSVNCDLNPTSRGLINEERLNLMKVGSVLINTARGPIVKERALIEALESGRLSGAALDVFEDEPLPLDSPLRRMENVLLAPHNANSSPRAWERVHWSSLANLFKGLGVEVPEAVSAGLSELSIGIGT